MITVAVRELLQHLNDYCTNALQGAVGLAVSRTHYEITVEHFFLKLLETDESDWPQILRQHDLESGSLRQKLVRQLEECPAGNSAKPSLSPLLLELFQDAWLIVSINIGEKKIRSGAILLAFLAKVNLYGSGPYAEPLKKLPRESINEKFRLLAKNSVEEESSAKVAAAERQDGQSPSGDGFLSRFCHDFTQKARQGGIDPVFGRDEEIRRMLDILARRRKNNPICVGEPGVGKTAVVEGLALRIVEGDVPDMLKPVRLIGLDMGLLEAGASVKGEFERRLKGIIDEVKASEQPIILFIDEAHTLVGAGGSAGSSDAANLLKPALARGELRTIAATTWKEYKKYFEKDAALARRFQPVKLEEPSVDSTMLILRGLKPHYEAAHKVIVRDDAVEAAARLSDRYLSGRFLPDKAIDLIDTSCARIKILLSTKPAILEGKERLIAALEREMLALQRDQANGQFIAQEAIPGLQNKIEGITIEAAEIRQRWQAEQELALKVIALREQLHADGDTSAELKISLDQTQRELEACQGGNGMIQIEVTPEVVAQVVSDWTGIPLGKLQKDQAHTVVHLKEKLNERIKGQDQALTIITEVIQAAKAGIKNPNQPMGVFLLAGPSGVGKTETGLALADYLFGSEKNVVAINMSEFQEAHTVSRLVGSPPGYVGYGEGGMLTEAVRQKPYSVVLLDEVEKAHLDVMNLFYQVFDKGVLTDGEGKEINFRNTVIILTSNLGAEVIQEMTAAGQEVAADTVVGAIRPVLSAHFKPALLARMTIVPFRNLASEAMKQIVELKMKSVQSTLRDNNRMELTWEPAVIEQLAARCTEVETGARNIEYILNSNILPRLSRSILTHLSQNTLPKGANLTVDDQGLFQFGFAD